MAINLESDDFILGVIGAGAMGRGIVQVAAAGGLRVKLFDVNQAQSQDAVEFVGKMLGRAAEKGQMTEADASAASGRIEVVEATQGPRLPNVIEAATKTPISRIRFTVSKVLWRRMRSSRLIRLRCRSRRWRRL